MTSHFDNKVKNDFRAHIDRSFTIHRLRRKTPTGIENEILFDTVQKGKQLKNQKT